jgi:hypothetical protein
MLWNWASEAKWWPCDLIVTSNAGDLNSGRRIEPKELRSVKLWREDACFEIPPRSVLISICCGDSHMTVEYFFLKKHDWVIYLTLEGNIFMAFGVCNSARKVEKGLSSRTALRTLRSLRVLSRNEEWCLLGCYAVWNRFGGTWRLLHQGDKNRWTTNNTSCNVGC